MPPPGHAAWLGKSSLPWARVRWLWVGLCRWMGFLSMDIVFLPRSWRGNKLQCHRKITDLRINNGLH